MLGIRTFGSKTYNISSYLELISTAKTKTNFIKHIGRSEHEGYYYLFLKPYSN